MINNLLIFALIVLILMLVALIIVLIIFAMKLLNKNTISSNDSFSLTDKKFISNDKVEESLFCPNHPSSNTAGNCLICEESFCEKCLLQDEKLVFCGPHFRIYNQNKWKVITEIKTTPDTPYEALDAYYFKRLKWKENQIPMFIVTHYKINTDEDFIESYVQLNVPEELSDVLKIELENKKGQV